MKVPSLFFVLLAMAEMASAQDGAVIRLSLSAPRGGPLPSVCDVTIWPVMKSVSLSTDEVKEVRGLVAGGYRIVARADGYKIDDVSIQLAAGETRDISIRTIRQYDFDDIQITAATTHEDSWHLDRAVISRSSAQNLGDLLRTIPGVDIRSDGLRGAEARVSLYGSSPNQVLVLVDGRRINTATTGEADLSSVPLELVESVRISNADVSRGSEAIGGIIEITTRNASDCELLVRGIGTETNWEYAFMRGAEISGVRGAIYYRRQEGPGDYRYKISADDGTGEFTYGLGEIRHQENNQLSRDSWLVRVDGRMSSHSRYHVTASLDQSSRGLPGFMVPSPTPLAKRDDKEKSLNLSFSAAVAACDLSARGSARTRERLFENPDPFALVKSSSEYTESYDGELTAGVRGLTLDSKLGLRAGREQSLSSSFLLDRVVFDQCAAFAQTSKLLVPFRRHDWSARPGAGIRMEIADGVKYDLPEATLAVNQTGSTQASFFFRVGESVRSPSMYELFWADDQLAKGNPTLEPERSTDFTAQLHFSVGSINRTSMRAHAGYQDVKNLIYWQRGVGNIWQPYNLKCAEVHTLSIAADQEVWNSKARISVGSDWTDARDASDDRNTGGKVLVYRAPRTHTASFSSNMGIIVCNVKWRWVDRRAVTESNSKSLSSYSTVDAELSHIRRIGSMNLTATIGARNLFGESYRLIRHAPMPLEEYFVSLSIASLLED